MKKMKYILSTVSLGFILSSLALITCHASDKNSVSIFKVWRYSDSGIEESITIDSKEILNSLSGTGLPQQGLDMKRSVVKITPEPNAKSGLIITHSEIGEEKSYGSIRWYELTINSVRLCFGERLFNSAKEVEAQSPGPQEMCKVYQAIRWGI
jgi:hypothetical protein